MSETTTTSETPSKKIMVATRLHLGKASVPPSKEKLAQQLENFQHWSDHENIIPVIAVDCTPKIEGYDYVKEIRNYLKEINNNNKSNNKIIILPVTPWGKFVPALNALVLHAQSIEADYLLLVSAEVSVSYDSILILCDYMTDDTMVAGAAMNGHLLQTSKVPIELNGRTCPWNTLALWHVPKLCLSGFSLVSDLGSTAGVEECVAIAVAQKLFPNQRNAKLIQLPDVQWAEVFSEDPERQKWHETKMQSKLDRAAKQMQQMGLTGSVMHYSKK